MISDKNQQGIQQSYHIKYFQGFLHDKKIIYDAVKYCNALIDFL